MKEGEKVKKKTEGVLSALKDHLGAAVISFVLEKHKK